MGWKQIAVAACTFAAFTLGASRTSADDRAATADNKWLGSIATKLGLNDQQREAIRKDHEACAKKAAPIEHQIWSLVHAEKEAIKQQLDAQQQTAFKQAIESMRHKELDKMASKLSLNAEQKQRLQAICNQFEEKFENIAASSEKGEKIHQQFRDMQHEFIAAVAPVLNPEQQAKLPFVVEEEHERWRDPAVRRTHVKEVLDQLNVSPEKREQIKKINASYEKQLQPLLTQLSDVRKEARDKMDSQLTAEQREKMREMRKGYGGDQQQ